MFRIKKKIVEEYIYNTEDEKMEHKKSMEGLGYIDSGQVKKDVNESFSNPDYRYYGMYVKYV